MSISNPGDDVSAPAVIPRSAPSAPAAEIDQELEDWDSYYKLLLVGKLDQSSGEFVVIHRGAVIAHGTNLNETCARAAKQIGIAPHKVVIPFVDNIECITME